LGTDAAQPAIINRNNRKPISSSIDAVAISGSPTRAVGSSLLMASTRTIPRDSLLHGSGTVKWTVASNVGLDTLAIERLHPHSGRDPSNQFLPALNHGHGGVENHFASTAEFELGNRLLDASRLPEQPPPAFGHLVGTDNDGIGVSSRHGSCLEQGQAFAKLGPGFRRSGTLIDIRRYHLELQTESAEQFPTIA
jgi:hypothetical protein